MFAPPKYHFFGVQSQFLPVQSSSHAKLPIKITPFVSPGGLPELRQQLSRRPWRLEVENRQAALMARMTHQLVNSCYMTINITHQWVIFYLYNDPSIGNIIVVNRLHNYDSILMTMVIKLVI